jgi:hypothetical protein
MRWSTFLHWEKRDPSILEQLNKKMCPVKENGVLHRCAFQCLFILLLLKKCTRESNRRALYLMYNGILALLGQY